MSNSANQEYTDYQLLIGLMLLHTILQKISEESGLKFDAFELRADKKNNQHFLIIWRDGEKLEPVMLSNKQIADCSLSEDNKDKMNELLMEELGRILQ